MVIDVDTGPELGDTLVIAGAEPDTVNDFPLLATLLTVTTTLPVVAPLGAGTTIEVALQLVGDATVPLNVTVLVPWVAPKFVPVIVTEVPTVPDVGDRVLMVGGAVTVKETPLLTEPLTVTTTFPLVAPLGTGTVIKVPLQVWVGAYTVLLLNRTKPGPCVGPKPEPLIVTTAPTGPELGERLVILGTTAKEATLLFTPFTVTTMVPEVAVDGMGAIICVALQLLGVLATPLNVTVLDPWVAPYPDPLMVISVPTFPLVGDMLLMVGAAYRSGANITTTSNPNALFEQPRRSFAGPAKRTCGDSAAPCDLTAIYGKPP